MSSWSTLTWSVCTRLSCVEVTLEWPWSGNDNILGGLLPPGICWVWNSMILVFTRCFILPKNMWISFYRRLLVQITLNQQNSGLLKLAMQVHKGIIMFLFTVLFFFLNHLLSCFPFILIFMFIIFNIKHIWFYLLLLLWSEMCLGYIPCPSGTTCQSFGQYENTM